MRNSIYFMGIASFLACMIFTVATSLTNPFYGMSESALAQATTYTSSTDANVVSTTYRFNGNIYNVLYPNEVTITKTTTSPTNTFGGSIGGSYSGFGAEGTFTRQQGSGQKSISVTYDNPTICNKGGVQSCSKSSIGETLFNIDI